MNLSDNIVDNVVLTKKHFTFVVSIGLWKYTIAALVHLSLELGVCGTLLGIIVGLVGATGWPLVGGSWLTGPEVF